MTRREQRSICRAMRAEATGLSDPPPTTATRAKRLRFRAWRRGIREADLVLGQFADVWAADLSEADLARFEALLDESDAEVYAWIAGLAPPPPQHDHDLLRRVRAFVASRPGGLGEPGA
jgi:antitoxin CptB